MDPRDILTQMIAMRGNQPGAPPAANYIPPSWWQGGGPQQAPAPMAAPALPPMPSPPPLPPGAMPTFPPTADYSGGFPLEGRSRMPDMSGGAPFPGPPPPQAGPPQQMGPPLKLTDEQKRMMDRMQGTAGAEKERVAPRNYGKGQLI